jgi:large subunit ribosomal protein L5
LDKQKLKSLQDQLALITGQQPIVRYAKQAVSAFDVKENQAVGLQVTLRRKRMYDFLKKLTSVILPSWKEFKGIPQQAITPQGNLTIGLTKTVIFPEINYETINVNSGMSVTIVTTTSDPKEAKQLFQQLGVIFETKEARQLREKAIQQRQEEKKALAEKKKAYREMAKATASEEDSSENITETESEDRKDN